MLQTFAALQFKVIKDMQEAISCHLAVLIVFVGWRLSWLRRRGFLALLARGVLGRLCSGAAGEAGGSGGCVTQAAALAQPSRLRRNHVQHPTRRRQCAAHRTGRPTNSACCGGHRQAESWCAQLVGCRRRAGRSDRSASSVKHF